MQFIKHLALNLTVTEQDFCGMWCLTYLYIVTKQILYYKTRCKVYHADTAKVKHNSEPQLEYHSNIFLMANLVYKHCRP